MCLLTTLFPPASNLILWGHVYFSFFLFLSLQVNFRFLILTFMSVWHWKWHPLSRPSNYHQISTWPTVGSLSISSCICFVWISFSLSTLNTYKVHWVDLGFNCLVYSAQLLLQKFKSEDKQRARTKQAGIWCSESQPGENIRLYISLTHSCSRTHKHTAGWQTAAPD